jgi:hypothetical protein
MMRQAARYSATVTGVAYVVDETGAYRDDGRGGRERVKRLSPETIRYLESRPGWMSDNAARKVVYNDPAVRLTADYVRNHVNFGRLPLRYEHDRGRALGRVLLGAIAPGGSDVEITAEITDPEMVASIKGSRRLPHPSFSIGYDVMLTDDWEVSGYRVNEISMVNEPFFENCHVRIFASREGVPRPSETTEEGAFLGEDGKEVSGGDPARPRDRATGGLNPAQEAISKEDINSAGEAAAPSGFPSAINGEERGSPTSQTEVFLRNEVPREGVSVTMQTPTHSAEQQQSQQQQQQTPPDASGGQRKQVPQVVGGTPSQLQHQDQDASENLRQEAGSQGRARSGGEGRAARGGPDDAEPRPPGEGSGRNKSKAELKRELEALSRFVDDNRGDLEKLRESRAKEAREVAEAICRSKAAAGEGGGEVEDVEMLSNLLNKMHEEPGYKGLVDRLKNLYSGEGKGGRDGRQDPLRAEGNGRDEPSERREDVDMGEAAWGDRTQPPRVRFSEDAAQPEVSGSQPGWALARTATRPPTAPALPRGGDRDRRPAFGGKRSYDESQASPFLGGREFGGDLTTTLLQKAASTSRKSARGADGSPQANYDPAPGPVSPSRTADGGNLGAEHKTPRVVALTASAAVVYNAALKAHGTNGGFQRLPYAHEYAASFPVRLPSGLDDRHGPVPRTEECRFLVDFSCSVNADPRTLSVSASQEPCDVGFMVGGEERRIESVKNLPYYRGASPEHLAMLAYLAKNADRAFYGTNLSVLNYGTTSVK